MHTLKRRAGMTAATVGLASVLIVSPVLADDGNLVESTVDYAYHCDSAAGHSETAYTMVATAPDQVVQGDTFDVEGFVVTGRPARGPAHLPHHLRHRPARQRHHRVARCSTRSTAPGSTDPPGPIAKKGTAYSSPAMSFTMKATGPVGSTIDIYPGNVEQHGGQPGQPEPDPRRHVRPRPAGAAHPHHDRRPRGDAPPRTEHHVDHRARSRPPRPRASAGRAPPRRRRPPTPVSVLGESTANAVPANPNLTG